VLSPTGWGRRSNEVHSPLTALRAPRPGAGPTDRPRRLRGLLGWVRLYLIGFVMLTFCSSLCGLSCVCGSVPGPWSWFSLLSSRPRFGRLLRYTGRGRDAGYQRGLEAGVGSGWREGAGRPPRETGHGRCRADLCSRPPRPAAQSCAGQLRQQRRDLFVPSLRTCWYLIAACGVECPRRLINSARLAPLLATSTAPECRRSCQRRSGRPPVARARYQCL